MRLWILLIWDNQRIERIEWGGGEEGIKWLEEQTAPSAAKHTNIKSNFQYYWACVETDIIHWQDWSQARDNQIWRDQFSKKGLLLLNARHICPLSSICCSHTLSNPIFFSFCSWITNFSRDLIPNQSNQSQASLALEGPSPKSSLPHRQPCLVERSLWDGPRKFGKGLAGW